MQEKIICVVGNPNCGKTTLFNELTGSHQEVGNWPGVTVDKKTGRFTHKGTSVEIVDLPGIYSITPSAASGDDERISRDYILTGEAQAVLNIVDASNLERNLFLTAQLIEMRVPMLVVVNMLDIAAQHKIDVDLDRLSEALGCPVVGLVASKSTGVSELKDAILDFLAHPVVPPMQVKFDARIEEKLDELETTLKAAGLSRPRWFAGQLLESASGLDKLAPGIDLNPLRASVERFDEERFSGDLDIALASFDGLLGTWTGEFYEEEHNDSIYSLAACYGGRANPPSITFKSIDEQAMTAVVDITCLVHGHGSLDNPADSAEGDEVITVNDALITLELDRLDDWYQVYEQERYRVFIQTGSDGTLRVRIETMYIHDTERGQAWRTDYFTMTREDSSEEAPAA